MRICLMIEGQESVGWPGWEALARACEASPIEALFRSDHYASVMGQAGRGSLDAWSTIAALAAVTSELRLGTLVSPVTFRHPSVLAKCAVTADHIAGGGRIAPEHLPHHLRPSGASGPATLSLATATLPQSPVALGASARTLREIEMEHILRVLEKHSGNKPAAAAELGISLKTLYNKLNQMDEERKSAG